MPTLDVDALRTRVTEFVAPFLAPDQLAVTVAALLLALVFVLALATIWRGRRRRVVAPVAPSSASGFTRWLTPMGMKSIPAEQAVVVRPRRRSGSNKTIKVSTPVSKVPTRALRRAGADALEIARKTGLARDAVVMMMANANPQAAKAQSAAKVAAAAPTATRSTGSAGTARAMSAPGAYGAGTPRAPQAPANGRTLGTQFNARLS